MPIPRFPDYPIPRLPDFPATRSLLSERLVERGNTRNDRRAILGGLARSVVGGGHRGVRRLDRIERIAGDDTPDLVGVEHFARQELLGELVERRAVLLDECLGALVV